MASTEMPVPSSFSQGAAVWMDGAEPRTEGDASSSCAVLFVHGFLGAGQNFDDLPHRLAKKGFFVRVMLLPGHGTSADALKNLSAYDFEKAVLEEIDSLRANYPCLFIVGHSMGGTLTVLAASTRSVDGIVLAAPFFKVTRKPYYLLPPETWLKVARPFLNWVYKGSCFIQVNRPEAKTKILSYRWVPLHAVSVLMELGEQAKQARVLSNVTCPCLILHGKYDDAAAYDVAKEFFESLPARDKTFLTLERSNHHLFFDYDAETVKASIQEWIEKRCLVKSHASKEE